MSHNCFISYKFEDEKYKDEIVKKLGQERINGKSLDIDIPSTDLDYVMEKIRKEYMSATTVTIFLIGIHSSENEGLDSRSRNKQNFIIRELQATLYDRNGNPRDGLLGVVLPEMVSRVYTGESKDNKVKRVDISDNTVIREFSANYWLNKKDNGIYGYDDHYAVLCKYSDFMSNPEHYINLAFEKTKQPISRLVHWRDIKHKGI